MSAPVYEFKMGTSASMTDVRNMIPPVTAPRDEFIKYPAVKELVSGGQRGMGLPQANWHWDVLQGSQYFALKAYQGSGANLTTSAVYIRTRNENNAFKTYLCDMIWPANIQWSAGRVLKIELQFRNLVEQP